MTDDRAKTPRTLLIADHLWETFASMASEMGSERDALMNQALYTFARLNGFLVPSDARRVFGGADNSPGQRAMLSSSPRMGATPPPAPPMLSTLPVGPAPSAPPAYAQTQPLEDRPAGRPAANAERVAELERQLSVSPAAPVGRVASAPPGGRSENAVEVDDSLLGDDAPQATSMELPNLGEMGLLGKSSRHSLLPTPKPPETPELTPDPGETPGASKTLVLLAEGRELDHIIKERFLIGRGKHCDLIINSGKVSREHAAITREGSDYFIEDLGSSNGTWHDKRRISRRQIQEGDEYFICAEKLSCTFR